jgi:hypothetical protein
MPDKEHVPLSETQEKIRQLRAEHLVFDRDVEFSDALTSIVDLFWMTKDNSRPFGHGNRMQQEGILVHAESGHGKTRLVENALRKYRHPETGQSLEGGYIFVDAPSPFSTKELGLAILRRLGLELESGTELAIYRMIRMRCAKQRILLIVIDEFSRYSTVKLVGKAVKMTEVKLLGENLASLMTGDDWPVALLLSGHSSIMNLWQYKDFETAGRRIRPFELAPVDGTYEASFAAIFQDYLTFTECTDCLPARFDLFARLKKASLQRLGVMLWYMQTAMIAARRKNEGRLTPDYFAAIYKAMAKCSPQNNLFLAGNWASVAVPPKLDYDKL